MSEIWKPVVGFEGFYEVSNLGRVKSLSRYEPYRRHPGKLTRLRRGRILTASKGSNGYYTVRLCGKTRTVHSLVLEAFIGPKPDGLAACHGPDFDTSNNRLSNLRWDTYYANNAERRMGGNSAVSGC